MDKTNAAWAVPVAIVVAGALIGAGLYGGLTARWSGAGVERASPGVGVPDSQPDPQSDPQPEPPMVEDPTDDPTLAPVIEQDAVRKQLEDQVRGQVRELIENKRPDWVSRCVTPMVEKNEGEPLPWKLRVRVATRADGTVAAKGIHMDKGPAGLGECLGELTLSPELEFPHAAIGVEIAVELP